MERENRDFVITIIILSKEWDGMCAILIGARRVKRSLAERGPREFHRILLPRSVNIYPYHHRRPRRGD